MITMPVILFFSIGTGVELLLLGWVSESISIINTVSLIMFSFLFGIVVGRSWGKEFFERMQWALKSRTVPSDEVLNGAVMALASLLLITPGVITDLLGLLIVIPITRGVFKDFTTDFVKKKLARGEAYYFFKG